MTQKRIFILNGHPAQNSLNRTLAETYAKAARAAGHDVKISHLHELDFDPDFGFGGYGKFKPLESNLDDVMQDIDWCEHLVLTTPMWWGGLPAKLKGLFDRAFLPGVAFDPHKRSLMGLPQPMLTGRTGRVLMTSDTPGWFMRWGYKNAMIRQIKDQILGFVGIKPVAFTHFSGASHPKDNQVENWIKKVTSFGASAI
jgi:putative NADPH-quinone reductase